MTANPKKAAALGLLLLVAAYFWAPLVWGYFGKGDQAGVPPVAAAPPPGAQGPAPNTAVPAPEVPAPTPLPVARHSWQQLARWIERDERMKPAAEVAGRRDPFRPVRPPVVARQPASTKPNIKKRADEITPAKLGWTLTSTIIGSRRMALIDGGAFALGDVIVAGEDGRAASADDQRRGRTGKSNAQPQATGAQPGDKQQPVAFELVEVDARQVVLQRGGRRYTLKIPPSELSSGDFIHIRRTGGNSSTSTSDGR